MFYHFYAQGFVTPTGSWIYFDVMLEIKDKEKSALKA
jgi:hypothetical protein